MEAPLGEAIDLGWHGFLDSTLNHSSAEINSACGLEPQRQWALTPSSPGAVNPGCGPAGPWLSTSGLSQQNPLNSECWHSVPCRSGRTGHGLRVVGVQPGRWAACSTLHLCCDSQERPLSCPGRASSSIKCRQKWH